MTKKITLDFGGAAAPTAPAKKPAGRKLPKPAPGKGLVIDFAPAFVSQVYMRDRTHTYLWLRDDGGAGVFLTMDSGTIELVTVPIVVAVVEPEVKADKKAGIKAKPEVTRSYYEVALGAGERHELTPYNYDLKKAVEKYHSSHLQRGPEAEAEMRRILGLPELAPGTVLPGAAPKRERARKEPAEAKPKQPGGYSLQTLCEELKMDPTEARKALRAAKAEKPGARWEWPNAAAAASIRAILEAAK